MLRVELDNILTEEDALGRIKEIFSHVEDKKQVYVVTKNGKPVFAIVDIFTLEHDLDGVSIESTPAEEPLPSRPPHIIEPPAPISEPIPTTPVAPETDILPPVSPIEKTDDLPSMPMDNANDSFATALPPLPGDLPPVPKPTPAPLLPTPPPIDSSNASPLAEP